MAVPINELFEEAITRAAELAENADRGSEALGAVVDQAHAMAERVAGEVAQAQGHFQEIAARLLAAEAGLDEAGSAAAGELRALVTQADAVKTHVAAVVGRVESAVAELEAEKARLSAALDQRLEVAEQAFERLAGRLSGLRAAAEERLQGAAAAIADFRGRVASADEVFAEAEQRFFDGLDELTDLARAKAVEYVEAVDAGLDATSDLRVELANRLIEDHNESVVLLREAVAEQAVEEIGHAVRPLRAAVEALAQLCDDEAAAVAAGAAPILDKVEEALQAAARMQPVLDLAQRLG
jgi:uncharacterized protein YoxC